MHSEKLAITKFLLPMENIRYLSNFEQTRKTVALSSIRDSNLIPMYTDEMIFTQNQKKNST